MHGVNADILLLAKKDIAPSLHRLPKHFAINRMWTAVFEIKEAVSVD
jgi:hypothetical protein